MIVPKKKRLYTIDNWIITYSNSRLQTWDNNTNE